MRTLSDCFRCCCFVLSVKKGLFHFRITHLGALDVYHCQPHP
jgi:hypothetical protein